MPSSNISRKRGRSEIWDGHRCFRIGDIVRIRDDEDSAEYFARILKLFVDNYAQPYAVVIWLIPKIGGRHPQCASEKFNPENFEALIAEECPVPIKACKFESHNSFTADWPLLDTQLCDEITKSNDYIINF